jgi:hypothetical protein
MENLQQILQVFFFSFLKNTFNKIYGKTDILDYMCISRPTLLVVLHSISKMCRIHTCMMHVVIFVFLKIFKLLLLSVSTCEC